MFSARVKIVWVKVSSSICTFIFILNLYLFRKCSSHLILLTRIFLSIALSLSFCLSHHLHVFPHIQGGGSPSVVGAYIILALLVTIVVTIEKTQERPTPCKCPVQRTRFVLTLYPLRLHFSLVVAMATSCLQVYLGSTSPRLYQASLAFFPEASLLGC